MASAKLEILISAKDAASQVMGRVKGAFALRAMEIQGISQSLVKNGEKVEKFLHGISLLKMATETESFKKTMDSISPTLQKATSEMLSYGVAIGGTLSLLKDISVLLKGGSLALLGPAALGLAGLAGVKFSIDAMDEMNAAKGDTRKGFENRINLQSGQIQMVESKRHADLLASQIRDSVDAAAAAGFQDLAEASIMQLQKLRANQDKIIAANRKAIAEKGAAELTRRQTEAMNQIKAMRKAEFDASPLGRLERIKAVSADLDSNRRFLAAVDPEKNAPYWLTLNKTVQGLNEELDRLKSDAGQGKISDMIAAARGAVGKFMRPGRTGTTTTTSLGTLPGAENLGDALSRQGLFSGGGRANTLTGLTERTLTSIDSGTKQQVQLLRDIWKAVTTGQTSQFGS